MTIVRTLYFFVIYHILTTALFKSAKFIHENSNQNRKRTNTVHKTNPEHKKL